MLSGLIYLCQIGHVLNKCYFGKNSAIEALVIMSEIVHLGWDSVIG